MEKDKKIDGKALIRMVAEKTGVSESDVLAAMIPALDEVRPAQESEFAAILKAFAGKDDDDSSSEYREMRKMMMQMKMLNLMMPGATGTGTPTPTTDVNAIIKENDAKWERRLEQMQQQQKDADLNRRFERLELLLAEGGGKKNDSVVEELKAVRNDLAASKEERHLEQLKTRDEQLKELRATFDDQMQSLKEQIYNREQPRNAIDVILEASKQFEQYKNGVRSMARTLGMTDEESDREIAREKGKLETILDKLAPLARDWMRGDRTAQAPASSPPDQTAQQQPALACERCGTAIRSGEVCVDCYNAIVQEQEARAEAEARKKGEIVQNTEQTETEPKAEVDGNP